MTRTGLTQMLRMSGRIVMTRTGLTQMLRMVGTVVRTVVTIIIMGS
jgi:hypothetical protein